jgi:hypothetical protein
MIESKQSRAGDSLLPTKRLNKEITMKEAPFKKVSRKLFVKHLDMAQALSDKVAEYTTKAHEIGETGSFYLSSMGSKGYAVTKTGELTSVFSLVPKQGDYIMVSALLNGACHCDCFDGYLVGFYKKHGFVEVRREKNWVKGEPDVVYMALPGICKRATESPAEYLFSLLPNFY